METMTTDLEVFQNFRLVTSDVRFLRYFTDDKFLGFHILEDAMSEFYAGDGEKILYRDKIYFNNLITVIFDKVEKDAEISNKYLEAQFNVKAPIPQGLGCKFCSYYKKQNRTCSYYGEMGITIRKNCADFKQKR